MAKYLRRFRTLESAREAGENGLYSSHVDYIDETNTTNLYHERIRPTVFNCLFDDNGYLIIPSVGFILDKSKLDGSDKLM